MKVRPQLIFVTIVAALMLFASAYYIQQRVWISEPLPVFSKITDFELVNQDGAIFTDKNLQDKIWVASFVFTSCSGPCPTLTRRVADVARDHEGNPDVKFVSITVDPEVDTPPVLSDYGKKFAADFTRWYFLTGKREMITTLMTDQFKLGFAQDIMFHSDRLALVDRKGRIRGYYEGQDRDAFKQLKSDLKKLIAEK